jgi:protein ImuB
MFGALRLAQEPAAGELQRLRLQLQQLSARLDMRHEDGRTLLLVDLGRGRQAAAAAALQQLQIIAGAAASAAVAPSLTTARLAVQSVPPAAARLVTPAQLRDLLAESPLERLAACRPHLAALHGLGVRHLADLADLPAAAVTVRFDAVLLSAWRALHGDEPPFRPLPPPPRLSVRRRLAGTVGDGLLLAAAVQGAAVTLGRELARRGLQARSLLLELSGDGCWSALRLLEQPAYGSVLIQRSTALLSAAAVTAGVDGLLLQAAELLPWQPDQLALFEPTPAAAAQTRQALDDLAARCGNDVLYRIEPAAAGLCPPQQQFLLRAWGVS